MKVLAVDTSSSIAAVAVMDDASLLGEYLLNHGRTHSQKLVPMIKEIMDGLELLPSDIGLFAASSGPGSFTGLRIGITTIKAMAFAVKKPVVSIPTLDALAYCIPLASDALVCPIMDARNRQVYTALYSSENGRQNNIAGYMGVHVDELVKLIKSKNRKVIFTGDAVPAHREVLKTALGEACDFAPPFMLAQRASSVAQLALMKASLGELENCFDMAPFYLRKSQAEREYDKKHCVRAPEDL
jgi:tRNA threonylcarbamoyladenosine biosynthesis protein TsaB